MLNGSEILSYFWKISFPTKLVGYTSLQQNTADYSTIIYYKTTNGGLNWQKKTIPITIFDEPLNFYTQGIHFINDKKGWIGGGGGEINFMETSNGGDTWTNITLSNTYRINKIRGFSDTVAYASGVRIHKYVYKPNITGNEESEKSDFVARLYPNPSSDFVIIETANKSLKNASLRIFNEAGILVSERLFQSLEKISVKEFARGMYFFKLSSEDKFWISKVQVE